MGKKYSIGLVNGKSLLFIRKHRQLMIISKILFKKTK